MLMKLIQSDPRLMDVFKELTGIDLLDMQEKEMKKQDNSADMKKQRDIENKKKKEEDEQKRQEAEDAKLPQEEREMI